MDEEESKEFKDNIRLIVGSKKFNEILPSYYAQQQIPVIKSTSALPQNIYQNSSRDEYLRNSSISYEHQNKRVFKTSLKARRDELTKIYLQEVSIIISDEMSNRYSCQPPTELISQNDD